MLLFEAFPVSVFSILRLSQTPARVKIVHLSTIYGRGTAMLEINLKGKVAFIAGIGDDQGFGWAIAKSLAEAGATLIVGTWTPILKIFTSSLQNGKFDASRRLSDGSLMEFAKIYPLDASFDSPEDVPIEIRENKRYKDAGGYTISEVAAAVASDFGTVDILVHSLANAPEVKNPLLETSRKGYLAAISSSSYSFVSLVSHFGPIMKTDGSILSLSYIASERVIPGYGGGMSSAKAALESDTRTLSWEAGRKWGIRINTISAGPLGSRAARAIGFIDRMIEYSGENAPLPQKDLTASEIGQTAAFLSSPLASAITGTIIYVDNGLHVMGVAVDSPCLQAKNQ
jgi:enoyl-[acyl-carrier protein] reductase I